MSRLFVSDLDGTLLDRNAKLSKVTRTRLRGLLEQELPFTVASARSIHSIAPILGALPLSLPVIELNGALITDLRTRTSLVCHSLPPAVAEHAMRSGLDAGIPPFVSTYMHGQQRLHPPPSAPNAGIAWYLHDRKQARDRRVQPATHCLRTLDETILCVTLIGLPPALAPIAASIEASHPGLATTLLYENRYNPGYHWLTVQSALATKEHALRVVAERCAVPMPAVTVFGDEINDVPMFRAAGRAVAVANAIDEVKALAHELIGPHHEDSVTEYLLRVHGR